MSPNTGTIIMLYPDENIQQASARIGEKLVKLNKLPDVDCWMCKGTGVGRITSAGKHVPCKCTKGEA